MKLSKNNQLIANLLIISCLISASLCVSNIFKARETPKTSTSTGTSLNAPKINESMVEEEKPGMHMNLKADPQVFNFSIPRDSVNKTCLKVVMAASFKIVYTSTINAEDLNSTVRLNLEDVNDYTGVCEDTYNTLNIMFRNKWMLTLNYTTSEPEKVYFLDTIKLNYFIDPLHFPNASANEVGVKKVAELRNNTDYSTKQGNSYKCMSNRTLTLNEFVKMEISNYQAQPFIKFNPETKDFDTAVSCAADLFTTTKLVPIIVGSALIVLVALVLLAYIIGRRKHRPGYQQV